MPRLPVYVQKALLKESRYRCAVCGSAGHLQLAHIEALSTGALNNAENLIVLCPTCHAAVDARGLPPAELRTIKQLWVESQELGKQAVLTSSAAVDGSLHGRLEDDPQALREWANALKRSEEFDRCVTEIIGSLAGVRSETEFLKSILKPLLLAMGFEGVTVLHHTGRPEHGKDMVFRERNSLGIFTTYAIVACIGKVHANSSRTTDSGHYSKLLDQVEKCFQLPYDDRDLKSGLQVDRVVIACSESISDEAMLMLTAWEERNRRSLAYLDAERIAGHKLSLHYRRTHRK